MTVALAYYSKSHIRAVPKVDYLLHDTLFTSPHKVPIGTLLSKDKVQTAATDRRPNKHGPASTPTSQPSNATLMFTYISVSHTILHHIYNSCTNMGKKRRTSEVEASEADTTHLHAGRVSKRARRKARREVNLREEASSSHVAADDGTLTRHGRADGPGMILDVTDPCQVIISHFILLISIVSSLQP